MILGQERECLVLEDTVNSEALHQDIDADSYIVHSEAWRYTGPFTRFNRFRGSFPGLGIATVAFAAYCGYEYLFLTDRHHAHTGSDSQGDGHQ